MFIIIKTSCPRQLWECSSIISRSTSRANHPLQPWAQHVTSPSCCWQHRPSWVSQPAPPTARITVATGESAPLSTKGTSPSTSSSSTPRTQSGTRTAALLISGTIHHILTPNPLLTLIFAPNWFSPLSLPLVTDRANDKTARSSTAP